MEQLVAVDPVHHRHLRINTGKAESHGATLQLIPVIMEEFGSLAVQHPLVFTKHEQTGQFICVAMYGFDPGENLYWQDDQWQALYLPLQVQRQPFFVGQTDEAKKQQDNSQAAEYVVCIDTDSPSLVNPDSDEDPANSFPLFTEAGEESPYFIETKKRLAHMLKGTGEGELFIKQLQEFKLLQSLSLEIEFVDGSKHRLNGLYTIDQKVLGELGKMQLDTLHKSGYLQLIYTMIVSLGQLYVLIDKKNRQLQSSATDE